jgi:biopolymer transport protein ExbD
MADVGGGGEGGGHGRHQKRRAKKLSTRIDMTPMVDLGFLLLTFFMLTTTFSKPKVIELTPPVKDPHIKTEVDTTTLTIVLSANNKVYYYNGLLSPNPDSANNLNLTDFSDNGIRKIVFAKNNYVTNQLTPLDSLHNLHKVSDTAYMRLKDNIEGKKLAVFFIIKTDSAAKYVNVVTMLDDMDICNVGKYALVDASPAELNMMRDFNNKHKIQ